jgi:hypothetical protein
MPGNTDQDQQELLHLNRDTPQPADRDTREINRAHTRRSNRDTPLFRLVNKPPDLIDTDLGCQVGEFPES